MATIVLQAAGAAIGGLLGPVGGIIGAAIGGATGAAGQSFPALTLTVTKKPGQNAVDVARAAHEQRRGLDDGGADALVSIGAHARGDRRFESAPQGFVGGQHIVHAAHALDAFGLAHPGSFRAAPYRRRT